MGFDNSQSSNAKRVVTKKREISCSLCAQGMGQEAMGLNCNIGDLG